MAYTIPPHKIEKMKAFLKKHSIDPIWDEEAEMFDGVLPENEFMARLYKSILEDLGEWDKANDCPKL